MPCQYAILMDGQVVVERWTGILTFEELLAHKRRQRDDPAIKARASVLSDCRQAAVEISIDAIDQLAQLDAEPGEIATVARYAFLVTPELYAKVQRFADRVAEYDKSVHIFNRLDTACKWLGLDPTEIDAFIGSFDGQSR